MHALPSRLAPIIALCLLLLLPTVASADSDLDVPVPADGATVGGSPASVEATFTQRLQHDGSSLQLRDASGALVASGGVTDDPKTMRIDPLPELTPGTYEVRWTTLSAEDPHLQRGTWTFTVTAPPAPAPTPEPVATSAPSEAPTAAPTPIASPAPTPVPSPIDEEPGATDGDALLPIVGGLALVVVGGAVLLTRRGRTTGA